MSIKNTEDSWGSIAKFFHWSIAILIIGMLLLGLSFSFIDSRALKSPLMTIHKSIGFTLIILVILRIVWRFANPTPKLPSTTPRWQAIFAHSSHGLLYLALLIMPLSGMLMSAAHGYGINYFWLFSFSIPFPHNEVLKSILSWTHLITAWTLSILLLAHLAGALKHHFIDKDNVLRRMRPCGND